MEEVQKQDESGKVQKKFKQVVDKLAELMGGGDKLHLSKKVDSDTMASIVSDLLKDERETNVKEIKEQLRNLLKGYADLKSEVKKKEEELKKLEEAKMKEFNQAADSLFNRIVKIQEKEKVFTEGLTKATSEPTAAPEE